MQKIKFDFDATKERIYAPNSNVPIGAPVDQNGNIANDGNAYGIVLCKETENEKYWVRYNLVVMVAGYCDIIDAQAIWGDEYSAEAMAAMSDITFCDNHELPTGGGGGDGDNAGWHFIEEYSIDEDVVEVVEKDRYANLGFDELMFNINWVGTSANANEVSATFETHFIDHNYDPPRTTFPNTSLNWVCTTSGKTQATVIYARKPLAANFSYVQAYNMSQDVYSNLQARSTIGKPCGFKIWCDASHRIGKDTKINVWGRNLV